ncbi:hypothetical protein OG875_00780 [Streptomyces sp. NBC_01498]|uniref:hypothetical protein n=1 Tax=Streptomyces sp. NBC_01498 TaxID=2975870 RepID=UPI002E7C40A0|nr:hypothetical protein [Streptomyces sp. NBC_01498]WTL23258.1 hypothetical protein OG875_00780 [Streptomyces sp. NBC_01498]
MNEESEANRNVNGTAASVGAHIESAAAKGRQTTGGAVTRVRTNSVLAASKAKDSARAAEKSAEAGVRSAGEATKRVATAGWANGRQAVASTAGKAATKAGVVWTVVKHRKAVAAGAAAGVGALTGGAFALGRRAARPRGPLSRLTKGRI